MLIETKMKEADGLELCRQACSVGGHTKVAVHTSYLDPEERRLALQAGAACYMLKEVDTDGLARRIRIVAGPGS